MAKLNDKYNMVHVSLLKPTIEEHFDTSSPWDSFHFHDFWAITFHCLDFSKCLFTCTDIDNIMGGLNL